MVEIVSLTDEQRKRLAERAKRRAVEHFGMEAMARDLEDALLETAKMGPVPTPALLWLLLALLVGFVALLVSGLLAR